MNDLPEGPRGKALAVGVCFLLAAVLYMILVDPLIGIYQSGDETLQARTELKHRLQVSADALPQLRAAARQLGEQSSKGAVLLTGTSPAVSAAELQSAMKEIVENSGAHLNSSEILAPEAVENFQKIGVHVAFAGDLTLLTSVLRGIETSHPAMFVDNVEIRGGADPGDDARTLAIAFDVYGFRAL